jgi:S1-C subfamily serine protease
MRQGLWAIGLSICLVALTACGKTTTTNQGSNQSSAPRSSQPAVSSSTSSSASGNPSGSPSAAAPNTSAATAVERVVQQSGPSIVKVNVSSSTSLGSGPFGRGGGRQIQAQGTSTGMVLDNQGHILTNNHVVTLESNTPAQSVSVDLPNGKTAPATIVGTDPQTDLAVIQIGSSDRSGLQPIQWADPNSIIVGEQVVAIGYALDLGGAPTVTTGVVSGINRSIQETAATISGSIQTDAAINPGNSGGPLLDLSGKVIGVTTAGLAGTSQQPVQGLNFAISSQTAQPVAQALVSQGHVTRGYMGVALTDVTPELAQANNLGVNSGAGIGQVTAGSPAAQAGLQPGDVITKVGDVTINNTGDLTNALTKYGPGQKAPITYYRGKNQSTTTITFGQQPSNG